MEGIVTSRSLGSGTFSNVYRANAPGFPDFALKVYKASAEKQMQKELQDLMCATLLQCVATKLTMRCSKCQHENVVKPLFVHEGPVLLDVSRLQDR